MKKQKVFKILSVNWKLMSLEVSSKSSKLQNSCSARSGKVLRKWSLQGRITMSMETTTLMNPRQIHKESIQ